MSKDVRSDTGLIGPNAILQLLPQLERLGGPERSARMLAAAGIFDVPDGTHMIPESDAARLHRQLRVEEPQLAPKLAAAAGVATADYILAHRIPQAAQSLFRLLPAGPAARLLSKAIAKHAWTFVGSGQFVVRSPWVFEVRNNPLIRRERSDSCLCHWHAAVFARLYRVLVASDCVCREVTCGAQGPGIPCRFEITRGAYAGG